MSPARDDRPTAGTAPDAVPDWADPELSRRLPQLRARGAHPGLALLGGIPRQARDLAADIAALASGGGGLVLLGVCSDGSLLGLPSMTTADLRRRWEQRVREVAALVEPAVLPRLGWAWENGHAIFAIEVPAGSAPVHYVWNRPWVRDDATSRHAEPAEVLSAAAAFLGAADAARA